MEEKNPSTRLTLQSLPHRKRRQQPEDEVSTVLTLWDPTWPTTTNYNTKKRKTTAEELKIQVPKPSSSSAADHDDQKTTKNSSRPEKLLSSTLSVSDVDLKKIQVQIKKEKLMKERTNVNKVVARLNELNCWGIKKTLTARDVEHLFVPTSMMNNHVLPYVDDKFSKGVGSREGAQVIVLDWDTHRAYRQSIFKLRQVPRTSTNTSSSSYVFFGIVKRRQLKEGDVIGLHWLRKQPKPIFLFSVLKWATQQPPPAATLHQESE